MQAPFERETGRVQWDRHELIGRRPSRQFVASPYKPLLLQLVAGIKRKPTIKKVGPGYGRAALSIDDDPMACPISEPLSKDAMPSDL